MKRKITCMDFIFDSLSFIALSYVLDGCKYAFRENIWYVFFFALDIHVLCKYWDRVAKAISNKVLRIVVIAIVLAIPVVFAYYFGILDISTTLRKW